jgi:hypothetical protein
MSKDISVNISAEKNDDSRYFYEGKSDLKFYHNEFEGKLTDAVHFLFIL